tara:strand:- start:17908 stop:18312 length:405 start_codon:yes stop_codon:yes gene_type:complete
MISDWHPLVIHFPIALISTSVAFDYLFYFTNRKDISGASWWTMFVGLISSLAAIASGIIDDSLIGHLGSVSPIWHNHGAMQIITIIGFALLFYIKTSKEELYKKYIIHYLVSGAILVAILFYGAHLGAQLSGRI